MQLCMRSYTDFIFFKGFFKARDLQHPVFKSRILGHEVSPQFKNFFFSRIFLIVLFPFDLGSCDFPMTYCALPRSSLNFV